MQISMVLAVGLGVVAASPAAGDTRPFPLQLVGAEPAVDGLVLAAPLGAAAELLAFDTLSLTQAPMPDGSAVDLELERISIERHRFGFYVDGMARPDLLATLDLSVWKGHVRGEPGSSVMLSFSTHGSSGWILRDGQLVHFMPRPDGSGDWSVGDVLVATEEGLARLGMVAENACQMLDVPGAPPVEREQSTAGGSGCGLKECQIAIESDFQLYQQFGNLNAMTTYVVTLLSYVSDRYETQVDTVLTFPYMQFYTTSNDPWDSQDSGGSCTDVLNEFRSAWAGNIPGGAQVGHFLSGANLGCGVAYLDVLCNDQFSFSVSGNMNGDVTFPVVQGPNNWDFMVVAHELGHNFGAPHTHDHCPPLDECPPPQYFGQCQNQQVCTNQGTLMSYCHLCPGGLSNITTFFHVGSTAMMAPGVQACLPDYTPMEVDTPSVLAPGVATPVSALIGGTPVGAVELHYRYQGGSFSSIAMTDMGGGLYEADLPPADCDDSPEYYYSFNDIDCGLVTSPPGAPGAFYSASVGVLTSVFSDDFQADLGWIATNLGASSGDWQRGVPVDDSSWDYDPASDHDGSGACYLTQNAIGNTDIDNGAVRLTSPVIDMTGGDVLVSYAYFLRLTNSDGADRLLVEVSSNGSAGPWTEIARHDTDGGLNWRTHSFGSAELSAAGVAQTATMALRITANDANTQSIVEVALDAFDVSIITCDDGGCSFANFCTTSPNSVGSGSLISYSGTGSVSANDFGVYADNNPPNQNGIFFMGPNEDSTAFGNGTLCVGGTLTRYPVVQSDVFGTATLDVDNTVPPALGKIVAGSTWKWQFWYRDPMGGGAFFNLSDGLSVTYCP